MTRASLYLVGFVAAVGIRASAAANPFDPSAYIEQKEKVGAEASSRLSSKSIFRINGLRYQKLMSVDGSVYLPSAGSKPELQEGLALCQQHMKLMREVVPMCENIPVEPEILKEQAVIVEMIRKCNEGLIRGPTLIIENADGSQVEVKAKSDKEKKGATK